jgi:prepilin-type N-terminal cleavage/methylation domain-containing protein
MPKRRGARSGFTLVEVVTVAIIISIMGYLSVSNFRGMQDNSNNVAVDSNIKTISLALEKYRSDQMILPTGGLIGANNLTQPNPQTFLLDANSQHLYLPNNLLPAGPFAPSIQGTEIAYPVGNPVFVTGVQAAGGTKTRKAGSVLGPGKYPMVGGRIVGGVLNGVFDLATYGAVTYSSNANALTRPAPTGNSDTYVLVGIGKKGQRAVIAAEATNQN